MQIDDHMKNVKQGAQYLGISPVTLRRILKSGQIGCFKIGSRIVFSKEQHLIPFLLKNESVPVVCEAEQIDTVD